MAKQRASQEPDRPLPKSKRCAVCGRLMEYRPRWANCWETVRACSAACRKANINDTDRALEEAILTLLAGRKTGASICPSEAARAVLGARGLEAAAMQRTRYAANRLFASGRVMITQRGHEVEPSTAKGPIRIILARKP